MADSLTAARAFANRLRFSGDVRSDNFALASDKAANQVDEIFYHSGIEISPALTPSLWSRLSAVCDRLTLPIDAVKAFTYSSPELQACCRSLGSSGCVINFSSALINFLDEDEFEFVAGHELGHFLLGHTHNTDQKGISPEYFMNCRSQEISVDRIGLHACNSLDTAIRALMKTVSGLTSRHLRFDVSAFISQLKKIDHVTGDQSATTHPSMLIRSKALLWYSLSDCFYKGEICYFADQIREIDQRIERDLARFVDGIFRSRIDQTKKDVLLWMLTYEIVRHGNFSKGAQDQLKDIFGDDTVQKLRNFLKELKVDEPEKIVHEKLAASRQELESLIPASFMSEVRMLEQMVQRKINAILSGPLSVNHGGIVTDLA
jgi:hypothetical protein